jgi:hypothetical protein
MPRVQLTTVRYIGRFLADPLEGVPAEVIDFLAGQLQIADPSCAKRYAQRQQTHREHAAKIRQTLGLKDAERPHPWATARSCPVGLGMSTRSQARLSPSCPDRSGSRHGGASLRPLSFSGYSISGSLIQSGGSKRWNQV